MASDAARKADTYRKIQLGGLVIKSGMAEHEPAVILGALIEALQQLQSDANHAARYKALGDASFRQRQGQER
ncbi:MAG: conjugal transfer protein TraD [Hyphomicrobiaceae bacterium]